MITYREYCKTIKEDWGKTSPIPKEVYDYPDPLKGINWIDLGLPSGTLWADVNVTNPLDGSPYWTWDDLMDSGYASSVPTQEQFQELTETCRWTWDDTRKGVTAKSASGKTLFFPALGSCDGELDNIVKAGVQGYYWSADGFKGMWDEDEAYVLYFDNDTYTTPNPESKAEVACGFPARLVKKK